MGIDYALACNKCNMKANAEMSHGINPQDYKAVADFLIKHKHCNNFSFGNAQYYDGLEGNEYKADKEQIKSQWISIEERLPPIHEKVLVYFFCNNGACDIGLLPTDINEIRVGSLNDTLDWYVYDHGSFNAHYVTHWQSLPEPPR